MLILNYIIPFIVLFLTMAHGLFLMTKENTIHWSEIYFLLYMGILLIPLIKNNFKEKPHLESKDFKTLLKIFIPLALAFLFSNEMRGIWMDEYNFLFRLRESADFANYFQLATDQHQPPLDFLIAAIQMKLTQFITGRVWLSSFFIKLRPFLGLCFTGFSLNYFYKILKFKRPLLGTLIFLASFKIIYYLSEARVTFYLFIFVPLIAAEIINHIQERTNGAKLLSYLLLLLVSIGFQSFVFTAAILISLFIALIMTKRKGLKRSIYMTIGALLFYLPLLFKDFQFAKGQSVLNEGGVLFLQFFPVLRMLLPLITLTTLMIFILWFGTRNKSTLIGLVFVLLNAILAILFYSIAIKWAPNERYFLWIDILLPLGIIYGISGISQRKEHFKKNLGIPIGILTVLVLFSFYRVPQQFFHFTNHHISMEKVYEYSTVVPKSKLILVDVKENSYWRPDIWIAKDVFLDSESEQFSSHRIKSDLKVLTNLKGQFLTSDDFNLQYSSISLVFYDHAPSFHLKTEEMINLIKNFRLKIVSLSKSLEIWTLPLLGIEKKEKYHQWSTFLSALTNIKDIKNKVHLYELQLTSLAELGDIASYKKAYQVYKIHLEELYPAYLTQRNFKKFTKLYYSLAPQE